MIVFEKNKIMKRKMYEIALLLHEIAVSDYV